MIEVAQHTYPDRDTLARSLAGLVADQLRAALASKGRATLAVPGGTTPGAFLRALADQELDWTDVNVLLTDERLVEEASDRSNAALLCDTLLTGPAASARLLPFNGRTTADVAADVEAVLPVDVLVLGMGEDLHAASLFPDAPELSEALDPAAPAVLELSPAGQPERRISLSGRVIEGAGVIHLLITGAPKAEALARALEEGPHHEAPVRVALTASCPVSVHYSE